MAGFFDMDLAPGGEGYAFDVTPFRSVGLEANPFMFGGIGLGAVVAAAEHNTGRATVWATAQYLAFAPRGSRVSIDVAPLISGRFTTQARVTLRQDQRDVIVAGLSLGARPNAPRSQWVRPSAVPPPEDCALLPMRWASPEGGLFSRMEVRIAKGWDTRPDAPDAGHMVVWMRPTAGDPIDRPMLALMGDFVPASIGNALGDDGGDLAVNSLDNCVRYLTLAETDYVLCDIHLQGASSGFAHGQMLLYAQDGTLMASANQSVIVRGYRLQPA